MSAFPEIILYSHYSNDSNDSNDSNVNKVNYIELTNLKNDLSLPKEKILFLSDRLGTKIEIVKKG